MERQWAEMMSARGEAPAWLGGHLGAMAGSHSRDHLLWWRREAERRFEEEVSSKKDGELEEKSHAASRESGSTARGLVALCSLVQPCSPVQPYLFTFFLCSVGSQGSGGI